MLTIEESIQRTQQGGVVAIPTETVYGLAADASQPDAVKRIFSIKGRPANHPLIVHIGSVAQVHDWAEDIPDIFWPLAEHFWPGPLTFIFKKKPQVNDLVTGGQDTIALRIPSHKKVLQLLVALKCGLAAPSANRFGHVSPTTAQHVIDEFGDDIEGVIDGGACEVGIESTIVDLSIQQLRILRPGQITQQQIEDFLGVPLSAMKQQSPRAPGMLKAHYAPTTPLVLAEKSELDKQLAKLLQDNLTVNVWSKTCPQIHKNIFWQALPVDNKQFAKVLYHQLRQFDQLSADITLIERPPERPEWCAVIDRLTRAAAHFSLNASS